MDNSPAWALVDLAAMHLNLPVVPLPYFFSPPQTLHAISDAGIDTIVCDQPIAFEQLLAAHGRQVLGRIHFQVAGQWLAVFSLIPEKRSVLPPNTTKVTYTSGTTGAPKGVCLGAEAICKVALSLQQATQAEASDRHFSVLPLSTLLENIAGIYVPLLAGATAVLLPSAEVGLSGSSGLNMERMTRALHQSKATTTLLTPELLRALTIAIEAGFPCPPQLRLVAVGGATVSPKLLQHAKALGLSVYEGYGLSECASVVAFNTAGANRPGSVGKPLPHVRLKFAEDGEILVSGTCLLGYAGNAVQPAKEEFFATGDIGYLDSEGFLYITGRRKNMFITSFGRNVAPEWVETELVMSPFIAQAALFGEARPWNVAVIVPGRKATSSEIDEAITKSNAGLPDYARVKRWILADEPFTSQNGLLTPNGRLKRSAIRQIYASRINAIYEETAYAVL